MRNVKGEIHTQTICVVIICIIAVGYALYFLAPVLIPFVLAIFFTYSLAPAIDFQTRILRFPPSVALVVTGLLSCLILALLALLISATVTQMYANVGEYREQVTQLVNRAVEALPLDSLLGPDEEGREGSGLEGLSPGDLPMPPAPTNVIFPELPEQDDETSGGLPAGETAETTSPETPPDLDHYRLRQVPPGPPPLVADRTTTRGIALGDLARTLFEAPERALAAFLTSTFGGIMNIISNGVLVLIFVIFMLLGKRAEDEQTNPILRDIQSRVQRYIQTMLFISALTGILVGAVLHILGVDFALMFGFLAFLLNFIPNIGSIIATLLPLPVAFLDPELSMTAKILVVAIPGTLQFVIGNLVAPKVMGLSLDLHPVVVLIALIFFGMIWGIVGMFLATPIAAVFKIAFEKMEYTKPIAALLAGELDVLAPQEAATNRADENGP
jgi:AI-2 transport protein TqsA